MAVIPGNLRYKIQIQRLNGNRNEYGETIETYTTVYTLRAEKKQINGNRSQDAKEVFHDNVINWVIYYRPILSTDLVICDGKKYRILYITDIGYKDGLVLHTELIND